MVASAPPPPPPLPRFSFFFFFYTMLEKVGKKHQKSWLLCCSINGVEYVYFKWIYRINITINGVMITRACIVD